MMNKDEHKIRWVENQDSLEEVRERVHRYIWVKYASDPNRACDQGDNRTYAASSHPDLASSPNVKLDAQIIQSPNSRQE